MSAVYHGATAGIVLTNGFTTKNPVTIASDAVVTGNTSGDGGAAIYASGYAWTIANDGTVAATGSRSNAIDLKAGGSIVNGASGATAALISGVYTGIAVYGAPATITNFGTIAATGTAFQLPGYISGVGIYLGAGGVVTNGASGSTAAVIGGYTTAISVQNTAATIVNFGRMQNTAFGDTIYLGAGATGTTILNQAGALITGRSAIDTTPATAASGGVVIANYGTIANTDSTAADIYLGHGGQLTNAAGGLIASRYTGVSLAGAPATLVNAGTIASTGTGIASAAINLGVGGTLANSGQVVTTGYKSNAIELGAGGVLINGASDATGALVSGVYTGIASYGAPATITNFGTIAGTGTAFQLPGYISGLGIYLGGGGLITNGASGSTAAVIEGYTTAITVKDSAGTIVNFGTLANTAFGDTIYLNSGAAGSTIVNQAGALITGRSAIDTTPATAASGGVVIANYGTIANTDSTAAALYLGHGGAVTNGSSNATAALIKGIANDIAIAGGSGTVVSFGTIQGTGTAGVGVSLGSGGSVGNTGLISAYHIGVVAGTATNPATVVNFGTIRSTQTAAPITVVGYGVLLQSGGAVINGSTADTNALIAAAYGKGVEIIGGVGSIANFGQIYARSRSAVFLGNGGTISNCGTIRNNSTGRNDVYLADGGTVINGSTGDRTALITSPQIGISVKVTAGTVVNFGTVASTTTGTAGDAVYLGAGGMVANYGLLTGNRQEASNITNGVIEAKNQPAVVRNFGTIATTNTGFGVKIGFGGTVVNGASNATGALITGSADGIYIGGDEGVPHAGAQAFVYNYGTISHSGTSGEAVRAVAGGTVTNHGLIASEHVGIGFLVNSAVNTTGTVVNFGTVAVSSGPSDKAGVYLGAGGQITNRAGAAITASKYAIALGGPAAPGLPNYNATAVVSNFGVLTGAIGVYVGSDDLGGNTIVNAGTITGTSGTAIMFGGTGGNLLVLENGYKLGGIVEGGASAGATNTLALAGSAGAAVTVNYNGLGLTNFQDVLFGTGGNATLNVSNTSGTPAVTISGFGMTTDVIDLTAIGTNGSVTGQSGTQVTISGSLGSVALQLDPSDGTAFMTAPDGGTGTDVTVACFCRGTLILTERGEVAVEALAIGDKVMTVSGEARPIAWIGRRSYAGRFAFGQRHILPVCIKTDALADGVPRRDLWISPNHALHLEGVLIEARDLINGVSIVQAERVEAIDYFHLELDTHDVIIAEGAAAESFVDDDSRLLFHNAHEYRALYPDAATGPARYCAPRRDQGCEVERARAAIARRAGLAAAAEAPPPGELRGRIDEIGRRRIRGWAQDTAHPEAAVCLDIYAGGELIGQVVANRHRADLAAAGLGSFRHGFEFEPPASLAFTPRSIQVRRSLDGANLTYSKALKQSAARRPRNASAR